MGWDALILMSGLALLVLLAVAYAASSDRAYPHHLIGYAMSALACVGIFWLAIRPYDNRLSAADFSPRTILARLRADNFARRLIPILFVLATLSSYILIIMAFRHAVEGASWIEELHRTMAHAGLGLVAIYTVVVGIVSRQRVQNIFGQDRHS